MYKKIIIIAISFLTMLFSVTAATLTCEQVTDTSLSITQFTDKNIEINCMASGGTVSNIQITPNSNPSLGVTITNSKTISSSLTDQSSDTAKWTINGDSPNTYVISYTVTSSGTNSFDGASTTEVVVNSYAQLNVEYVDAPTTYTSGETLDFKITNIGGTTANNIKLQLNSEDKVDYPSTISPGASASYSWTSGLGYEASGTYTTKAYIETTLQDSVVTTVNTASNDDPQEPGSSSSSSSSSSSTSGINPWEVAGINETSTILFDSSEVTINGNILDDKIMESNIMYADALGIVVNNIALVEKINDFTNIKESENINDIINSLKQTNNDGSNVLNDILNIKQQLKPLIRTNYEVFKIIEKDGTEHKITKIVKTFEFADLNEVKSLDNTIQIIEIIPKNIAQNSKLIDGDYKVLVDDSVISFDILLSDYNLESPKIEYYMVGDVSSNLDLIESVSFVKKDSTINSEVAGNIINEPEDLSENESTKFSYFIFIVLLVLVISISLIYRKKQR